MDCIFKTACSKIIRKYSSEECRWKRAVCIHCYYVVYLNQIMIIQRRDWGGSCPESLWITDANWLEMSPWTQTSVRQISCINTENIRHKTFHSFLLCVFILNICMLQLYILNHYSTYFVIVGKDAMVQSPWQKQTLVCDMKCFSGIPNKPFTHNIQKDHKKIRLIQCSSGYMSRKTRH